MLLDYRKSQVTPTEKAWVGAHLDYCEFCNAELPLLDRCPAELEETAFSEIPRELRRLAEELMRGVVIRTYMASETADYPRVTN